MKAVHIFTHTDADGKFSGSLIYEYFSRYKHITKFFIHEIDYTTTINEQIHDGDIVTFTDYSFTNMDNMKFLFNLINRGIEVLWIDHHASSGCFILDECFKPYSKRPNFKYIVKLTHCATYLTYEYLWKLIHGCGAIDFIKIPDAIKYVDSYDTWKHDMPDDIEFNYGLNKFKLNGKNSIRSLLSHNSNLDIFDYDKDDKVKETEDKFIKSAIDYGFSIKEYVNNKNKEILDRNAFEFTITDYTEPTIIKGLAVNNYGNSLIFGDEINNYDIVCCFHKVNKEQWKYSLFSANNNVHCNRLAEIFGNINGLGGGGHKGAAGFQTTKCIFDEGTNLFISRKMISKKLKVSIMNDWQIGAIIPYGRISVR